MTQYLPPNLLALFAAREPLPFLVPADKLPHEKKRVPYSGVGAFLDGFEDPKDTPPPTRVETRDERKDRKRRERQEQHAYKLEQDLALWDPATNNTSTDPFKTLFVARINYDTSESKLRREFENYGPVKKICLINDRNTGKPRGYGFIEYEHERDMHTAYKHADGKKIDGRRVLVDVERGRTVKGWRPRRLGGGLGGTRKGGPDENTRFSGRDEFGGGGGDRGRDDDRGGMMGGRRDRSRSRERRRRSRSKERVERRRSRSRERRRRSGSRERRRSRERPPRPDRGIDVEAAGPEGEEDVDRKDRKRSRRSRSRDRSRRSRSRDRKRGRRSRSREKKHKIKVEDVEAFAAQYPAAGPGAEGDGMNGHDNREDEGFEIRVKEEKADAYKGYGGDPNKKFQGDMMGSGDRQGEMMEEGVLESGEVGENGNQ